MVVHGMDIRMTDETIMEGFASHEQNPEILGIKRIGRSTSVVITFAEAEVPRTLVCFGMIMKCFLFNKHYEVCCWFSELGHRSHVCNSPETKCRGCGMSSPPEDRQSEAEDEKASKTALQQQQQMRSNCHDGARDRSKSMPRDCSASFPRLTPST
ncbi:hypothetical protein HPB51_019452 [Rhipicephalus microplus]|uniref:Uncharacterized protein n=1 Tax=Rhipicephalus microplus TaxID=6941 RepID=A0A9J6DP53_RHIMP|nr:hypothetical protein HPB51_019452 [Rhipicephalus microplus]